MTRRDEERLKDIVNAVAAIRAHLERGSLDDGLIYDAVRMRLIEIGEAAKAVTPELRSAAEGVPWRSTITMRDLLAHRYFDTERAIVSATVRHDLEPLLDAVRRLLDRSDP